MEVREPARFERHRPVSDVREGRELGLVAAQHADVVERVVLVRRAPRRGVEAVDVELARFEPEAEVRRRAVARTGQYLPHNYRGLWSSSQHAMRRLGTTPAGPSEPAIVGLWSPPPSTALNFVSIWRSRR